VPALGAITSTATVHVAPAAIDAVENVTDAAPATGAKTGVTHPAEIVAFGGVATIMLAGDVGNVSENAMVFSVCAFGLTTLNWSFVGTPIATGLVRNDFVTDGGLSTVR
jgi:hypothetical protein